MLETLASEAKEPQRITKDEVDAFDQVEDGADAGEVLHDGSSHQFFEIDNASFREGLVWRLKQGDDRITAYLLDDEFQQRIEDGERFGKGDVLEVDLKSGVICKCCGWRHPVRRRFHWRCDGYRRGRWRLPEQAR